MGQFDIVYLLVGYNEKNIISDKNVYPEEKLDKPKLDKPMQGHATKYLAYTLQKIKVMKEKTEKLFPKEVIRQDNEMHHLILPRDAGAKNIGTISTFECGLWIGCPTSMLISWF